MRALAGLADAFLGRIASIILLLGLWELAARIADSPLLPGVGTVALALLDELVHGPLIGDLAATLFRVAVAFVIGLSVGTALGIVMGRSPPLDRLLDSWIVLLLNLPALVVAVLAYVWFGLIEAAAIGAVAINKLPNAVVTLREGARALERDHLEMAQSFRLGSWRTLRHIVLPQLSPYLMVAARSGLALIWKVVLVVELLGRSNGIGFRLQIYFQLFDVTRILAYAIAFIVVIQVIEWGILQPLEAHLSRWRR